MEREVEVEPGVTLWVEDLPAHREVRTAPVLLVMGANESGMAWPEGLLTVLRERHRVIRYDHRDTGRSSRTFEEHPYAIADLAGDACTVLDACGVERAHLVGMSMGGLLVQLLALDAPERLASAALLCTTALGAGFAGLPGPPLDLLRMWQEIHDVRDEQGELAWRVEHQRRLAGSVLPFDPHEVEERERRVMAHAGRVEPATAHSLADVDGLDRGDELGSITVPTLVVESPEDPVHPPPHAYFLAERIGGGRAGSPVTLVTIDGMGHTLPTAVLEPLAAELLEHAADAEDEAAHAAAAVPAAGAGAAEQGPAAG